MKESYDEHRKRDEESILNFLIFNYMTGWFSWLIPALIVGVLGVWIINVLGESTILNDPNIYYSGINPWTGEHEVFQGCRPEHLTIDRKCNNEITLDLIKKSFPFLGEAKELKR